MSSEEQQIVPYVLRAAFGRAADRLKPDEVGLILTVNGNGSISTTEISVDGKIKDEAMLARAIWAAGVGVVRATGAVEWLIGRRASVLGRQWLIGSYSRPTPAGDEVIISSFAYPINDPTPAGPEEAKQLMTITGEYQAQYIRAYENTDGDEVSWQATPSNQESAEYLEHVSLVGADPDVEAFLRYADQQLAQYPKDALIFTETAGKRASKPFNGKLATAFDHLAAKMPDRFMIGMPGFVAPIPEAHAGVYWDRDRGLLLWYGGRGSYHNGPILMGSGTSKLGALLYASFSRAMAKRHPDLLEHLTGKQAPRTAPPPQNTRFSSN